MSEEVTPVQVIPTPDIRRMIDEIYSHELRKLLMLYFKDSLNGRVKRNFPISIFRDELKKLNDATKTLLENV